MTQTPAQHTITVLRGDGIGPEIMDATLHVLDSMQLGLSWEFAEAGMTALESQGELLPAATMDSIRKNRIALKSPLTTPVGERPGVWLDRGGGPSAAVCHICALT
jgi:isocitrate dehydrogenase (NAD+)